MKLTLAILAALIAVSFAANGVLIGKWSFKGTVYNPDECAYFCCCPQGNIDIEVDPKSGYQVVMKSTSWSDNAFCQALGMRDATTPLPLPYNPDLSFADLQQDSADVTFHNGAFNIVYYVNGIAKVPVTLGVNTTQLNLTMDQQQIYAPDGESGATCTIIMNKFLIPLEDLDIIA